VCLCVHACPVIQNHVFYFENTVFRHIITTCTSRLHYSLQYRILWFTKVTCTVAPSPFFPLSSFLCVYHVFVINTESVEVMTYFQQYGMGYTQIIYLCPLNLELNFLLCLQEFQCFSQSYLYKCCFPLSK
jgi:hypothetical protein